MKRRPLLLLTVSGVMIAVAAVGFQKKPGGLLLLEWAGKSAEPRPPVAVLIELGLKDERPINWSGRATVTGARVVHREGYRFRDGDKLIDPDRWEASSHRPLRLPKGQPALTKIEGMATVGVVLHLADVQPDAKLTVSPRPESTDQEAAVALKDVLAGKPVPLWGGAAVVRLITTATPVVTAKTEDDFPAACYGPDGTLWVAYISYTLKDESRRIEQAPYKEQPKDFKALYRPEFGDQLFVKYYRDGKWSEPIAVTDGKQDLVRCAIAAKGDGTVIVVYSANRGGRHDLYARTVSPKLGKEQRLTGGGSGDEGVAYLSPVMSTTQSGELLLASQVWRKDGLAGIFHQTGLTLRDDGWSSRMSGIGGGAASWHVAIAVGSEGQWRIACDEYLGGDYDVMLPYRGTATESSGGGDRNPVASSSRFEARPSICYDPAGRLWIAYEEGPEKWGKDYGALDSNDGYPLYNERSVRVVCLVDGKLMRPAAELPTSSVPVPKLPFDALTSNRYERQTRYAYPKIGIDGKGRVWLTYRQKFGTRYSSHPGSYWLTFARRLDGDKWSEPIEVHHSDGLLDHRPVLLPHPAGGLRIIHNTDGRYTTPESLDNQIYMSYIDLPGEPVEPRLVPHEPGRKDEKLVQRAREEQEAVKRIRAYRIEAGGKKYQP
ncbi:MAG TPA: hypothetical protein VNK04_05215, partial [Gemmataceae bacterium]|nr:hypothetical protein [Gemmataceae bacterium]